MAKPKPAKMLAVLGRSSRTGRWRVASRSSVLAVLGAVQLDMRHSYVENDSLKMKVTVVLGSATFTLPSGAEVRPSGMALLSSSSVDVPDHDEKADLPVLEIEWTVLFGRLRITADNELDIPLETGEAPNPAVAPPLAAVPAALAFEEPAPAVGFEDLDEPAPAVGFEDLDEPAPAVGFEDLDEPAAEAEPEAQPEPAAAVGFEDLDEPEPEPASPPEAEPAAAVGFEDLDEEPGPEPVPVDEPAPAVGFEDLD